MRLPIAAVYAFARRADDCADEGELDDAARIKALEQMEGNAEPALIEASLRQSEGYLVQSGDPVQTGKTRIEMARLKLKSEDRQAARQLAEKARKDFADYMEVFFPDDLRPLLADQKNLTPYLESDDQLLGMFTDVIQELSPDADFDGLLANTVKSTNRYFGAERGGIFWFKRDALKKAPALRGA